MVRRLYKTGRYSDPPIVGYTTDTGSTVTPDGREVLGYLPDGRPVVAYVPGGVTVYVDGVEVFVPTDPSTVAEPDVADPFDPYAKYRHIPYGWWNGHWLGFSSNVPSRNIDVAEYCYWANEAEKVDGLPPAFTVEDFYLKDLNHIQMSESLGLWKGWVFRYSAAVNDWVVSHELHAQLGGSAA
jgi:hypothetical protein